MVKILLAPARLNAGLAMLLVLLLMAVMVRCCSRQCPSQLVHPHEPAWRNSRPLALAHAGSLAVSVPVMGPWIG